jgi:predicted DNA-binding transcriptional regulator AlpA
MPTSDDLLDYAGIAQLTGLSRSTLRNYRTRGYFPEPDELLTPDRPRWRTSTVRDWLLQRPGRGSPGVARRGKHAAR